MKVYGSVCIEDTSERAQQVARVSLAALVCGLFACGCGSEAEPGARSSAPAAVQGDTTNTHSVGLDTETGVTTCTYPLVRGEEDDEKWAHLSGGWNHVIDDTFNPIRWRMDTTFPAANNDPLGIRAAIGRAFGDWASNTFYKFTQTADTDTTAEITLTRADLTDKPGFNTLAVTNRTLNGNVETRATITFDSKDAFTGTLPPGVNQIDIQPTATHEIGHAMGLDHSNPPGMCPNPTVSCDNGPMMFWLVPNRRSLISDDLISARAKLPVFSNVSGLTVRSIAAGGDGSLWAVDTTLEASGGYRMYKRDFSTSSWTRVGGHGIELAVQGDGTAWHVNLQGETYRMNSSGTWVKKGTIAMSQIAAGGGAVWALGLAVTRGSSEHTTYQWNSTTGDWVSMGGEAIDIAVDSAGVPWHVNASGAVYRRPGGSWTQVTHPPGAPASIEAGADGTVWITSVDASGARRMYLWNEQTALNEGGGGADTPAGVGWMFIPGYDTNTLDVTSTLTSQFWTVTTSNTVATTHN